MTRRGERHQSAEVVVYSTTLPHPSMDRPAGVGGATRVVGSRPPRGLAKTPAVSIVMKCCWYYDYFNLGLIVIRIVLMLSLPTSFFPREGKFLQTMTPSVPASIST